MHVTLNLNPDTQLVTVSDNSPTISVQWDQAVQQAVINTSPGPTIASRAYAIMHTAIYDAWAAYDPTAIGTQLGDDLQVDDAEITDANKQEAMSFAAYRVLTELFPSEKVIFDHLMMELGFDPNNKTTDTTTAAGIGNVVAEELMEFRRQDGSNQLGNDPQGTLGVPYSDNSGYKPSNEPGDTNFIERWTPEFVPIDAAPGEENRIQTFLTPQWGNVTPFALESGDEFRPEAPQPFLLVDGEVDLDAKTITLNENTATYSKGQVLDITKSLVGEIINPEFITQAEDVVDFSANLTDEQKLIAEFWEDGGGTAFPPGTWMTFGQFVSARDDNSLDEDVKLFFALGNAVFDAGIATWEAKRFYDYVRPVRAIRELGDLGLIGEFNSDLGGYAIQAWTPNEGTQTILATDFLTYQTPGQDPSPPFAEYTSGHSAFSASAAEVLRLFTESDDFGASVTFEPGQSRFEPGITPTDSVTLLWETFSEAADEAGISRLYGGIHFEDGDLNGRNLGTEVGNRVFEKTLFFINGGEDNTVVEEPVFATPEDDDLFAPIDLNGENQIVFTGAGDDQVDVSQSQVGRNRIFGGSGADTIYVSKNDRVFGSFDDDIFEATDGQGGNRISGGAGDDIFYLGYDDVALGGSGNDTFFVQTGGDNIIAGGAGVDKFWVVAAELPDTANTVIDLELGVDIIGIGGFTQADLSFGADAQGHATLAVQGTNVATFLGITQSQLEAATFTFG